MCTLLLFLARIVLISNGVNCKEGSTRVITITDSDITNLSIIHNRAMLYLKNGNILFFVAFKNCLWYWDLKGVQGNSLIRKTVEFLDKYIIPTYILLFLLILLIPTIADVIMLIA